MDKKNKNRLNIHLFSVVLGIIFTLSALIIWNFTSANNGINILDDFPHNYKIITPHIPNELFFCDERVPLENIDIKEKIEREFIVNTYWHSSTILHLKRSNRWFPVIEPILKKNGLPDDIKYISIVESNLENAISPKGATGFWQFMKETAKKYGLEVNNEIDERYNIEKSTEAACKYLKEAYEKYGSWTLAAASYNLGMNGITNQIKRQKSKNYYKLVLNDETTRYISRIISMKEILNNPSKYGFDISQNELYPELEIYEISIKSKVEHFADFAKNHGIDYKTLKYFNPWLRENYLTNKNKNTYHIKLPEKGTIYIIDEKQ
ncbi:lytic transglycosylase domain-containing protein [Bacteroidota bacterium]